MSLKKQALEIIRAHHFIEECGMCDVKEIVLGKFSCRCITCHDIEELYIEVEDAVEKLKKMVKDPSYHYVCHGKKPPRTPLPTLVKRTWVIKTIDSIFWETAGEGKNLEVLPADLSSKEVGQPAAPKLERCIHKGFSCEEAVNGKCDCSHCIEGGVV